MTPLVRFAAALFVLSVSSFAQGKGTTPGVPACAPSQLSFATDSENGNFDGMSHSGTLLVLRNLGPSACRLEAFPELTLSDAKGQLKISFSTPGSKFMHPGPVMIPAIVAAGAEATASLRWVSGPVFNPGVCFKPATISVQIGQGKLQTALAASVCGATATSVSVEKTRFNPDPVYSPAAQK